MCRVIEILKDYSLARMTSQVDILKCHFKKIIFKNYPVWSLLNFYDEFKKKLSVHLWPKVLKTWFLWHSFIYFLLVKVI